MTELFATMVMQQTQMALMLLGQMPHPETGQPVIDLEGARLFIGQLEMLEVKTKGNLNGDETELLQQSLAGARMAFVEVMDNQPQTAAPAAPAPAVISPVAAAEDESQKRFSKKY